MGDFPIMTDRGTFSVNGVERVIISQIVRSPGAFFTSEFQKGKKCFGAKIIPNRGAWIEFETDADDSIHVRIDRKRKLPVTVLLKIFGFVDHNDILDAFKEDDKYIKATLAKDTTKTRDEGYVEMYKRIRPGDLATVDNAKQLVNTMFFSQARYDLSEVGRYKFNTRIWGKRPEHPVTEKEIETAKILSKEDIVAVIKEIIRLNDDPMAKPDDIDHLGNRRIRAVGELLQNKLRIGLVRMERIIKDRMSTLDVYTLTPAQVVNARPLMAVVKEFFTSHQLSQFLDQVNPLAELEHKRRISAMGPGGLTRERAGFEVRDVHISHYGRICPIQTPEGPNIGLVGHLASYARLNPYGFLETPYFKVKKGKITKELVYFNALEEEQYNIAHGGVLRDKNDYIIDEMVEARVKGKPGTVRREEIDLIDVSPYQSISVPTSLIPFLEHDDANRALMGSNMQRQAVPCIQPEAPLVSTGVEARAAMDSGQVAIAGEDGEVVKVDASEIRIRNSKTKKEKSYILHAFF